MRKTLFIVSTLLALTAIGARAHAEEKANSAAAKNSSAQTSHDFEDLLVQGKYHFSDEAVTTVEEDKVLDSLIGVRQDFKDKIENSDSQF
jgi:hypothetical protein